MLNLGQNLCFVCICIKKPTCQYLCDLSSVVSVISVLAHYIFSDEHANENHQKDSVVFMETRSTTKSTTTGKAPQNDDLGHAPYI